MQIKLKCFRIMVSRDNLERKIERKRGKDEIMKLLSMWSAIDNSRTAQPECLVIGRGNFAVSTREEDDIA